ncbi:DUF3313 family protein [Belnapia sp. T18]|uniref:DUF3313 family protein n=1 Tax=Belnapia arida TaxID=2804533 RepID=A0ABS1UCB9_9PROT|nr:DUF3313 family protein [Belnapia arida]MBL6082304.1 DUF3313 family protein [Belnapia arida]
MLNRAAQLRFYRRWGRHVAGATLILALGACNTQRLPDTLALASREQLQPQAENERRLAMLPRAGTDMSAWPSVWIDTIEVSVPELTAEESELVRSTLREALATELGKSRSVAGGPGPGVLRVRAIITSVTTSNVAMNAVLTAVVIAPLLNGGAAAEIVAEDSVSGKTLAALVAADERRFSRQLDYFRRTGHARAVLSAFAGEFADIIDPRWRRDSETAPPPRGVVQPVRPSA